MRSKVVRTLALALLLCGARLSQAQTYAPPSGGRKPPESSKSQGANAPRSGEKSKLEEMLAEALKNNPDIRVAAAKLAEAEAELNRTRLQVLQKIVAVHAAIASKKTEVAYRQKEYQRYQALLADRAIDAKLVDEQEDKLALAKAQLAELEAQMPALLGKSPRSEKDTVGEAVFLSVRLRHAEPMVTPKIAGPMAERLRKALQTPVKVDYKDMTLTDILKDLEKKAPGLSFHIRDVPEEIQPGKGPFGTVEAKLNLHFDMPLPIAALLQALTDTAASRFYVRDYGILVTGVVVPREALTVEGFMRQKPAEK
jgi:hypothetical protein